MKTSMMLGVLFAVFLTSCMDTELTCGDVAVAAYAVCFGGCSEASDCLDIPMVCNGSLACNAGVCACDTMTEEIVEHTPASRLGCEPNNSGCETAAVVNGKCTILVAPQGTLCGGSIADPIHGECNGNVCNWTDYQCKYDVNGAECGVSATPPYNVGGHCANGTCCRFCVNANGECVGDAELNGNPCP